MVRKITIMITLTILTGLVFFFPGNNNMVLAQNTPGPEDISTLNKIAQEHRNTRKFFSDELEREKKSLMKEWDDRANYYEDTFFSMLNHATFKLALLWGGIVLFITGLNNVLRMKLEKKRYKELAKAVGLELKTSLAGNIVTQHGAQGTTQELPKTETEQVLPNINREVPVFSSADDKPGLHHKPGKQQRKSYIERLRQRRADKKLKLLQKQKERLLKEELKLKRKTGVADVQPGTGPREQGPSSTGSPGHPTTHHQVDTAKTKDMLKLERQNLLLRLQLERLKRGEL